MSDTTTGIGRPVLAFWFGLAAAISLGFGCTFPLALAMSQEYHIAISSFAIVGFLFFASIALVVAVLVLTPAPKQARGTGAVLAAAGYFVALALCFLPFFLRILPFPLVIVTGITGAFVSVVVVGLVVSGLLVGLGFPGRSFAWLPLLLLSSIAFFLSPGFGGLLILNGIGLLTAVLAGLIICLGSRFAKIEPARRAQRDADAAARAMDAGQAELARRAADIRTWEEAYALAHNGERPPVGLLPPAATGSVAPPSERTNTLAILALVFSIIGSVVGLVLGYIARSQIRRTGENGAGLALAAIIIGWVEIGLFIVVLVVYVVLLSVVLGH